MTLHTFHKTLLLSFFLLPFLAYAQLPSFPNAHGAGSRTPGGRGGIVIEVTNLNDAGPGSFRAALNTSGARTIVFRTGGVITLQSDLQLTEPYVTVAGQTAPGDGIVLKDFALSIFTHDIIIRGMRFRPGDDLNGERADLRDCIAIQQGSHDIIIDHCSLSWGLDENLSMQDTSYNITVQWCIISEGLYKSIHPKGPHSMGMLIGFGSHSTSVHHNIFAHNNGRNPVILGGTNHEFVNNVIYNWGYNSEFLENGALLNADIAGNYWKPLSSAVDSSEFPLALDFDSSTAFGSQIYCNDNFYLGMSFLTPAQIQAFGGNAVVISSVSLLDMPSNVTRQTPATAYNHVLASAGALHPQRDATDTRVVQEVTNTTGSIKDCIYPNPITLDSGMVLNATTTSLIYDQVGRIPAISPEGRRIEIVQGIGAGQARRGIGVNIIDSAARIVEALIDSPWNVVPDSTSRYKVIVTCENDVGSYPAYAAGTAPLDTDHDGMPDTWETAQSLNPNNAADRNGTDLDTAGYTNLEVYLNGLYDGLNTATRELTEVPHVKIYPNPFTNAVAIELNTAGVTDLSIYDLQGNRVSTIKAEPTATLQTLYWNGTTNRGVKLPPGTYFLAIKSGVASRLFTKVVLLK